MVHALGDIGKKGFKKEMVMIVHETIGKAGKRIFQTGIIDLLKKYFPVLIIIENRFSPITPGSYMVDCILKGKS
jgi:hypothetical protein